MFTQFEPAVEGLHSIGEAGGITLSREMLDRLAELLTTYRRNYLLESRAPRPKRIRESLDQIGEDADRLYQKLEPVARWPGSSR
jgi:hypothetical protein